MVAAFVTLAKQCERLEGTAMKDELAKIAQRCEQALEPLPVASPFARDLREIMGMIDRLSYSPVEEAPADAESIVASICQDVAELPDRTSPDDWPDAMLVTAEELGIIIERHFTRLSADLAEARKVIDALPERVRAAYSSQQGDQS